MTAKKQQDPPPDDYSFGVELPHQGEGYDPTWNLPSFAPLDNPAPRCGARFCYPQERELIMANDRVIDIAKTKVIA